MSKEIVEEEAPSLPRVVSPANRSFDSLRSVQWRINLRILPSSSVDDLRRETADSRRRYAGLRRRLLVDPHVPQNGRSNSADLVIDNPLSQNPDSTWGRYFRGAELEKMVDQDLSRLYPEHGSYFQTPGCQGMLRRILLLWCLGHPECGYRQGMHELLAPLLYVLHVDVERLSEVRKLHEDHFIDKFDGLSFEENDVTYNFDFKKFLDSMEDEVGSQGNSKKVRSLDELDPEIQTIILLSDAYGAEGELGIVLSEKFMEHDAYCMFEALMNGARGLVAMADFFAPVPAAESHSGLPPVIEASAALYDLLSIVDSSLHSHLVELGVEPQYFALRWLRVLFGREFSLQNLLVVWDEIFRADNSPLDKDSGNDESSSFKILKSHRGALITAMAVSMILYVRSSLLATENATTCLQRLLNFPENINLKKLIAKAKSLQILALDSKTPSLSSTFGGAYHNRSKSAVSSRNLSSGPVSPNTPLSPVPDSYWEEKWRVMHKAEELRQDSLGKEAPSGKRRWSDKVKLVLSRTESDPSPARAEKYKKGHRSSVRRSLLDDLSRQLGLDEDTEKGVSFDASNSEDHCSIKDHVEGRNGTNIDSICTSEERCESGSGTFVSDENSSIYSDPASSGSSSNGHENDTEKSSVASNLSSDDNDDRHLSGPNDENDDPHQSDPEDENDDCHQSNPEEENDDRHQSNPEEENDDCHQSNPEDENDDCHQSNPEDENDDCHQSNPDDLPLPVSSPPEDVLLKSPHANESSGKIVPAMKERRQLSDRFQWLFKFGRNHVSQEASNKGVCINETSKCPNRDSKSSTADSSTAGASHSSSSTSQRDAVDQNVLGTLKNLGQSMIEHIQVLESVFQQDRVQVGSLDNLSKNNLVGKGQVTAMTAFKELRKISNLLSEM